MTNCLDELIFILNQILAELPQLMESIEVERRGKCRFDQKLCPATQRCVNRFKPC